MSELLEVLFENISISKVYSVLSSTISNAGEIINIHCTDVSFRFAQNNMISEADIDTFLKLSEGAVMQIKFDFLKIDDLIIPSVLLQLHKYEDKFDIDFNFDEQEMKGVNASAIMKKIHWFVSKIGELYGVELWYGGMEPASDEATRYFTDNSLGPLL